MKKVLIVIFLIIGFIGCLVYYFAGVMQSMTESVKTDGVRTVNKCPEDYSKLFNENKNLVFNETNISKTRNPISKFTYNDKFRIFVYRVSSMTKIPLKTGIINSYSDEDLTDNVDYGRFGDFDQFQFLFKSGIQDKVSKVYLNIEGQQTQMIKKNDTIACYYSRFKNFDQI